MRLFVDPRRDGRSSPSGVRYLRIEGAFYCRNRLPVPASTAFTGPIKRPAMSVVLTVISLGTRVLLAYLLSALWGEVGIWLSIPIGWVLADLAGLWFMKARPLRV